MTRTVFAGGTLYDGTTSDPAPGDLAVEAGRIVEVGSGLDGDEVVDCTGHWVSPGFFDTHVHVMFNQPDMLRILQTPFSLAFFQAVHNLRRTLDVGITSVRDASGADLGVKEAIETGLVAGPRMQISISMLSQTGGHGDPWQVCGSDVRLFPAHPGRPSGIVDGVEEVRKLVRTLVRMGADVIKIATSGGVLSSRDDPRHAHFRDAEIAVAVEEASAAGIFVMAHAQASEGIKSAIRNGVRSIEHGVLLDDEAIAMMLERGTYLVPTLIAPRGVLEAADRGVKVPQYAIDKTRMVIDVHRDSISRAIAAGVKVAMGTDSGVTPHGQNLRELEEMVGCGMTPAQALISTTRVAAELLGIDDDRGVIEAGKRADVVIARGDALDVAGLGQRIRTVVQDGKVVVENG